MDPSLLSCVFKMNMFWWELLPVWMNIFCVDCCTRNPKLLWFIKVVYCTAISRVTWLEGLVEPGSTSFTGFYHWFSLCCIFLHSSFNMVPLHVPVTQTYTEFFIIILQGHFWLQSMWRTACRYQWRKAKTPAFKSQSKWQSFIYFLSKPTLWTTWRLRLCIQLFCFHISTLSSIAVPSNLTMPTPSADTWLVLLPRSASMEPTAWSRLRCVFHICGVTPPGEVWG